MSLKSEASKGVLWVLLEKLGHQIIQLVIFIVLARLLTPEDFGLVAMIVIFFAISQTFIDSGFGQALIRKKEISQEDRSTVFWFNLALSVCFYALIFFSAPAIASFYEREELVLLARIMGLAVVFFGIAIVQRSEMTHSLEFKKQAYAQIPAVLIAGIVSIILAYNSFGVWALAIQYLLISLLSSIMLWILYPIKINAKWSKESFFELFSFAYKLLISGLIGTLFQHIYKLIIGKFFAASTLGLYTPAKKMQRISTESLVAIIQKITYPLLAKVGEDLGRLKRGYKQVIQTSSFIIFPCVLCLIVFSESILHYVLGEIWIPASPFLRIICISGMIYHLHSINLNVLKVLGRSDLFLKLEVIKKVNISIAIVIGLQYGVYGLLVGQVVSSYIANETRLTAN